MFDDLADCCTSQPQENENQSTSLSRSTQTMWFLSGPMLCDERVRYVPIHPGGFLVGRRTDSALCLSSRTVSSIHAKLTEAGESLALSDLGSTNGTYVNGQRVREPVELRPDDIVHFADVPFRVLRQKGASNSATACEDVCDQALALVQFDRLMAEESVIPNYQPIVDLREGQIIGYEVLVRSRVPGLEMPAELFSTAAQLNLESRLSRMIRWKAVQETMSLARPPHLFLNTHPAELEQSGLIESMTSLRQLCPEQEITLEVHEAALTNPGAMKKLCNLLRDLNIRVAFDDFGAGQARLAELSEVSPDYLKFDISLIRSIDQAPCERVEMVTALVNMTRKLGIVTLAEGVEQEAERTACVEVGFELAQGFLFGKPFPLGAGKV
jgi:EAL domain-containing protein (putative c-di-GMP-specific phosphodiesterase class I)